MEASLTNLYNVLLCFQMPPQQVSSLSSCSTTRRVFVVHANSPNHVSRISSVFAKRKKKKRSIAVYRITVFLLSPQLTTDSDPSPPKQTYVLDTKKAHPRFLIASLPPYIVKLNNENDVEWSNFVLRTPNVHRIRYPTFLSRYLLATVAHFT